MLEIEQLVSKTYQIPDEQAKGVVEMALSYLKENLTSRLATETEEELKENPNKIFDILNYIMEECE